MMVTAVPESAALSNVHYLIIKKEKRGVENSPSSLSHLVQPVVYLYPWQPEGRASYEIKATGSQETGHICFDVFTLHKRRWQPLNVSRPPMSSSPPAATSLSLLSLSGSDISKSITRPQKNKNKNASSLHLCMLIQDQISLSSLMSRFVVILISSSEYETCPLV